MALTTNLPTQRIIFETKKFNIEMWLNLVERCVREYGSKGSSIQTKIVKPVDTPCFKALLKFSKKAKKWL
jgi:hypothetical protein